MSVEAQIFDLLGQKDPHTLELIRKHWDRLNLDFKHPGVEGYRVGWTLLHKAAEYNNVPVVELLLKHPRVNVNAQTEFGTSPIGIASSYKALECFKIFLDHPNVDLNIMDKSDFTLIKWIYTLNRSKQFEYIIASDKTCNQLSSIEDCDSRKINNLYSRYIKDPQGVKYQLRLKLKLNLVIGDLFALIVLHTDDYFKVPKDNQSVVEITSQHRFFGITSKLPMELQMVISHRVFESSGEIVLVKDSKLGFQKYLQSSE